MGVSGSIPIISLSYDDWEAWTERIPFTVRVGLFLLILLLLVIGILSQQEIQELFL